MADTQMPQPAETNRPASQPDDSFFDLLAETLENLEESVRGPFLQQFFRSIARIELTAAQSLEHWSQILKRRIELSENLGRRVSLRTALIDVLASTSFMRVPILMEYEEFKKLQLNAATDALTGLHNRRLFEEYTDKELNRAKRYGQHLALALLDLHQLKQVNDRHGHLQGDQVLQLAASTLRKSLRASDFAFRIGGDEFALLLPQADPEQAAVLCDRLRANFETELGPLKLDIGVKLDYGIAVHPQDGDSKEALMRIADRRLYQLKNSNRQNPVRSEAEASPLPFGAQAKPSAPEGARPSAAPPAKAQAGATVSFLGRTEGSPYAQKRKWERVSLAGTRAYAVLGGDEKNTASVLDLCTGGLALSLENPDVLSSPFFAVLHVPILPPLRVNLRKVYTRKLDEQRSRLGCAFVS
ncbi:MAG TPA: GGDEF domain-containing protein [Candidatus Acidoferrales bacterium]|nr:GGDEF domain-containing protein [Candidatus Acidoferrales bacterium]